MVPIVSLSLSLFVFPSRLQRQGSNTSQLTVEVPPASSATFHRSFSVKCHEGVERCFFQLFMSPQQSSNCRVEWMARIMLTRNVLEGNNESGLLCDGPLTEIFGEWESYGRLSYAISNITTVSAVRSRCL